MDAYGSNAILWSHATLPAPCDIYRPPFVHIYKLVRTFSFCLPSSSSWWSSSSFCHLSWDPASSCIYHQGCVRICTSFLPCFFLLHPRKSPTTDAHYVACIYVKGNGYKSFVKQYFQSSQTWNPSFPSDWHLWGLYLLRFCWCRSFPFSHCSHASIVSAIMSPKKIVRFIANDPMTHSSCHFSEPLPVFSYLFWHRSFGWFAINYVIDRHCHNRHHQGYLPCKKLHIRQT